MKILIGFLFFSLLFISIEILTKKKTLSKELSRKIAHIVAGTIAAFLPFYMDFGQILILSLLFIPVMLLSKNYRIFTSIHEVSRQTYGEVYFPISLAITAAIFPVRAVFMYGVLVMALSDGFASVSGQRFGHQTYTILRSKKSYAGSLAFFLITFCTGLGLALSLDAPLPASLVVALAGAFTLTTLEAMLSYGLDNLLLPPAAAFLFLAICRTLQII